MKKRVIYFIIFAFFILYLSLITGQKDISSRGDHFWYLKMAKSPFNVTPDDAPYAYRIGTPLLVYILPLEIEEGFLLITYTGIILKILILYLLLLKLGFSEDTVFFTVLMAITSIWFVRIYIYYPFLTDVIGTTFFLLSIYLYFSEKLLLYCFCVIIGVFFRETVLFSIPVCFIHSLKKNGFKVSLLMFLKFMLLPVIVYSSFRLFYLSNAIGFLKFSFINNVKSIKEFFTIVRSAYFDVFGVMIVIVFLAAYQSYNYIKRNIWIIIPVLIPLVLIFFSSNTERVIFIALPSVSILFANAFEKLIEKHRINKYIIFIPAYVLQFLFFYYFKYLNADFFKYPGILENVIIFLKNNIRDILFSFVIIYWIYLLMLYFIRRKKSLCN